MNESPHPRGALDGQDRLADDRADLPDRNVATGNLPPAAVVADLTRATWKACAGPDDGVVATVYPALAAVDRDLFGVALVGIRGDVYEAGDSRTEFTIMSCAKPLVFALACQANGLAAVRHHVGINATGRSFNSVAAVEVSGDGRTNPMVNAGALVAAGLLAAGPTPDGAERLIAGVSAFAGRDLHVDEATYASAMHTNHRNRSLAHLLFDLGALETDPAETLRLYTMQSCLLVTAVDLAVMGATLADGGRNPITGHQVIDPEIARAVLVVMSVAGLYENSGDWLFDVGLPGKSGIGGGIVTVSPGKGGLGTFAPPLDPAGNSVKGQRVAARLARSLGLDLFASQPHPS